MATLTEVKVPDIGDFDAIPVIEIHVKAGDAVKAEDSLITLESDKATMDVPAPAAGVVKEVKVALGDKVSQGSVILLLEAVGAVSVISVPAAAAPSVPTVAAEVANFPPPATVDVSDDELSRFRPGEVEPIQPPAPSHVPTPGQMAAEMMGGHKAHASPSVRAYARELGVEVGRLTGSGPKGRILREDVQRYVKGLLSGAAQPGAVVAPAAAGGVLNLLPWPQVDFAKFGPVESQPLSRIKKISGANLARNWAMIPHVTQFDEADITDLEAFRVQMNKENEKGGGAKLTMLAFLLKACVVALKKFPEFNASLDGDNLVLKQYFHIGFAADTPNGLMVPVIRNVDQKSVLDLAVEMAVLAKKAREGKLAPAEMQGGCFSISSLGGIGGTAFTPIINAPEVAILGVSKSETKPRWNGREFEPRLMLPLSLSYDHRVIDGAAAARFTSYLAQLLADLRRSLL
ncbi:dihydrolipoyllysine-residue acetyltransferase [Denitratisoma oestradiolicum]|uniref:Acetyltransferase component of pyruvate dehydrogenase complex n=1 Tax=Denitratisoma oestradiolicum TaxID=311182 RepID=A0A6S6Y8B6_9PROT|nr:dihydrolipoyllysine-residue acetyltransferase [Denitratisoma oestradiolicum]TWO81487.1 dihydrolipoyllysine-residue acetyltransferase [Denitratisoma oestradiolicum]CAB1368698.1 Dihydrolipoyllysine-residue acetyltransferase component of pyruvate dehydrogenase complex [Denitratisoma oestradiolicum]